MKSSMLNRRTLVSAAMLPLALASSWLLAPTTKADATNPIRERPEDFVELTAVDPSITLDIRYLSENNFVGRPIPGYRAPKCLLTRPAAEALSAVQHELKPMGYGLRVFDCYRPQQAVDAFVAWGKDLSDQQMKARFYPRVDKAVLFEEGYIAAKSSHSRGSTVDLTMEPLDASAPATFDPQAPQVSCEAPATERTPDGGVDMGTGFDCFSPLSHTLNPTIAGEARPYRLLLKTVMDRHGFENLAEEWWHFTLRDEPYPNRYFDFPVE